MHPVIRSRFLLILCVLLAVGCTKNARLDTIRASMIAADAATEGFKAWDRQHQEAIVAAAEKGHLTNAEVKAQLADYREKRDTQVIAKIIATLQLLDAAVIANDDLSLKTAFDAVKALSEIVKSFQKQGAP